MAEIIQPQKWITSCHLWQNGFWGHYGKWSNESVKRELHIQQYDGGVTRANKKAFQMAKSGMIKQQIRLVLNYNPKYKINIYASILI